MTPTVSKRSRRLLLVACLVALEGLHLLHAATNEPYIAGIDVSNGDARVTIVFPSTWCNTVWQIYSLDAGLDLTSGFNGAVSLWDLAETNLLLPANTNSVQWLDSGQMGRGSLLTSSNRFYAMGYSRADADGDRLSDGVEILVHKTDFTNPDTDGDGMADGVEISLGLNPLVDDARLDPDGDGFPSGVEVFHGSSPTNTADIPDALSTVSAGTEHTSLARADGAARTWGWNGAGRLGFGTVGGSTTLPTRVVGLGAVGLLTGVVYGTASESHTLALTRDGTVWAWGNNGSGRLGINSTVDTSSPVRVHGMNDIGFLSNIVAIAAGDSHNLALDRTGSIWAWGDNGQGRLGDDSTTARRVPVRVFGPNTPGFFTNAIAIAAGLNHSLALRVDGTVWAWGSNGSGQLGDGTTATEKKPGQVLGLGGVGFLTNIVAISAGTRFSLALDGTGRLWAWGDNADGRLGDNTITERHTPVRVVTPAGTGTLDHVVAFDAGASHSLAVRDDGTVWAWGNNGAGRLGDNTTTGRRLPVQVHGVTNIGFLTNIVQVSAGDAHSLAKSATGLVYTWGNNGSGRLGDGTTVNRLTPVLIDSDNDGLPDDWEVKYFGDFDEVSAGDPDGDSLVNLQEFLRGTDPTNPDTDGDGYLDGYEVAAGTDPLNPASYPRSSLSGTITYPGPATGVVRVTATYASNNYAVTLAAPGAYTITNLPTLRSYAVTSFRDTDGNGSVGLCEPRGLYALNPVFVSNNVSSINVTLVVDSVAPVLATPSNGTISCSQSASPSNTGYATAIDNLDPAPVVTYADATQGGACPAARTILRAWSATDACGNTTVATQVIYVVDVTAPVLFGVPTNVTVSCASVPSPASVTATDACDTNPAVVFIESTTGTCPTLITRVWTAMDACGNSAAATQRVTVVDTEGPAMAVPADVTVSCDASTEPAATGQATAQDGCASDDDGLVLYYAFDQDQGGTVPDLSGYGHAGSVSGATYAASGRFGGAYYFDGVNDGIDVAPDATLNVGTGRLMTVSAWFKPEVTPTNMELMYWNNGAHLGLRIQHPLWSFGNSGLDLAPLSGGNQLVNAALTWTVGAWQHFVVTYDGVTGEGRMYVNGEQVSQQFLLQIEPNTQGRFYVGMRPGQFFFKGWIDEVRVYNRVLSGAEVGKLYGSPSVVIGYTDATDGICPTVIHRAWTATDRCGNSSISTQIITRTGCDADGDQMPDCWELAHGLDPFVNDANGDADGDTISNLDEYMRGTDPQDSDSSRITVYADPAIGSDTYDGFAPTVLNSHGPKSTIRAAISAAMDGDTIQAAAGVYTDETLWAPGAKQLLFMPVGDVRVR